MNDKSNIPLLTDLIEKGAEIELSDLGLGEEFAVADALVESRALPSETNISPALELEIRRILDEHTELAFQEIRLAIQQATAGAKSESTP